MNLLLTSKSLWWVTIVDNKFNFQNCGCWRLGLTESPLPFLDSESLSDGDVCQEHKGDQYNETGLGCTYVFETDLFENLGHTCSFCKPLCHEQSFGVLWKNWSSNFELYRLGNRHEGLCVFHQEKTKTVRTSTLVKGTSNQISGEGGPKMPKHCVHTKSMVLKGFLCWHGALQGPSTSTHSSKTTEKQGHYQVWG